MNELRNALSDIEALRPCKEYKEGAKFTKAQWEKIDGEVEKSFWLHAPIADFFRDKELIYKYGEKLNLSFIETLHKYMTPVSEEKLAIIHYDYVGDIEFARMAAGRCGQCLDRHIVDRIHSWPKTVNMQDIYYGIDRLKKSKFYGPYVSIFPEEADDDKRRARYFNYMKIEGMWEVIQSKWVKRPILIQATPDVIRLVIGVKPTVVEWEDKLRVLCVIVPQIRADFYGNCGIAV